MHPNCFEVDGATDHGRERPVLGFAVQQIQLCVAQVADARSEAEAEQMHESEDVIREAGGVSVMLLDPQVGLMVKQPIEDKAVGVGRRSFFAYLAKQRDSSSAPLTAN